MLVLDLGEVDMFATKNNEWVDRLTPAPQGEGGFDACWYPVAMSDEVAPGAFHRAEFLDGHVIVVRTSTGVRKCVVSGKSVSVRVDLGGRLIIKNKKRIT